MFYSSLFQSVYQMLPPSCLFLTLITFTLRKSYELYTVNLIPIYLFILHCVC